MKILWNSSTPIGQSGYGVCTREICRRLKEAGHDVRIATKHGYFGHHEWGDGIFVFDGNLNHLNQYIERQEIDYVISYWDVWVLNKGDKFRFPRDKWVGLIPIDTERMSPMLGDVCRDIGFPVANSQHGKRELEALGFKNVLVAPCGVDTKVFKPNEKAREEERAEKGWDDGTFAIGSVGINYPDDRKGFIALMMAFRDFHDLHPEARLYIHTHAFGKREDTMQLYAVARNLKIQDFVSWPDQMAYDLNFVNEQWLSDIYNAFDVFYLPTRGEGFGIPLIEAQACGVPVITSDFTTGPELVGDTGWLIPTYPDDDEWLPVGTWRRRPRPSEILNCMEIAYSAWKHGSFQPIKDNARTFALQYDWNAVWENNWKPILKMMESGLSWQKYAVDRKAQLEKENPDMEYDIIRIGAANKNDKQ